MDKALSGFSWLVTARPWITLLVLVIATIALAAGASLRAAPQETASALPQGSPITEALADIEELFAESGEVRVVTLLFRGDALTPGGLSQMSGLLGAIAGDPDVSGVLAPENPIVAPSYFLQAALQVQDFGSVTQAQIDSARGAPQIGPFLDMVTGTDSDGTEIAIASIQLLRLSSVVS